MHKGEKVSILDTVRKRINKIFSDSLAKLKALEKEKELIIYQEELLQKSIKWLRDHQHPEGFWGYESVADTSLTLLALAIYEPDIREWDIKDKYKGGIEKAVNWLKSVWSDGSWEGNVWDTSITLQALIKLGLKNEKILEKSVVWLKNTIKKNYDNIKPHHLAQALNVFTLIEDKDFVDYITDILLKKIRKRIDSRKGHEYLFDPYVTGQVVDALINAKVNPLSREIKECYSDLERFINEVLRKGLSEAAFQDCMMVLLGIASYAGTGTYADLVNRLLPEIFKTPDRYKKDGSWYKDAKKTAIALIALSRVKRVRKIDSFATNLYLLFGETHMMVKKTIDTLEDYIRDLSKTTKSLMIWLSMSYILIIVSIVLILSIGLDSPLINLATGIILTLALPYILNRIYKQFRFIQRYDLAEESGLEEKES